VKSLEEEDEKEDLKPPAENFVAIVLSDGKVTKKKLDANKIDKDSLFPECWYSKF
jgi:hypothetical protein